MCIYLSIDGLFLVSISNGAVNARLDGRIDFVDIRFRGTWKSFPYGPSSKNRPQSSLFVSKSGEMAQYNVDNVLMIRE